MLVWYRRFDPVEAGSRSAADSLKQWGRMQAAMTADRQRMDSLYGCRSWAEGYQDGRAWVCRVPPKHGTPNWAAELQSLDSLILAQPKGGIGRRDRPIIQPPPPGRPEPVQPGVTPYRRRDGSCMDGGSWYVEVRDTRGTREFTAPNPSGACPRPDGPEKQYAAAGWEMLQKFMAAVR